MLELDKLNHSSSSSSSSSSNYLHANSNNSKLQLNPTASMVCLISDIESSALTTASQALPMRQTMLPLPPRQQTLPRLML